jgi:hypothetical protein
MSVLSATVDVDSTPLETEEGGAPMWDTVETNETHLSHDMPCVRCGHALHTFLACGDGCDCEPALMPGEQHLLNV